MLPFARIPWKTLKPNILMLMPWWCGNVLVFGARLWCHWYQSQWSPPLWLLPTAKGGVTVELVVIHNSCTDKCNLFADYPVLIMASTLCLPYTGSNIIRARRCLACLRHCRYVSVAYKKRMEGKGRLQSLCSSEYCAKEFWTQPYSWKQKKRAKIS